MKTTLAALIDSERNEGRLGEAFCGLCGLEVEPSEQRERLLHLAFLAWLLLLEPPPLTQGNSYRIDGELLAVTVRATHSLLSQSIDAEHCFVFSTMMTIAPWIFGTEESVRLIEQSYRERLRGEFAAWWSSYTFPERGLYADYFQRQLSRQRIVAHALACTRRT